MPAGSAAPLAPETATRLQWQCFVFEMLQWLTLAGDALFQIQWQENATSTHGLCSTPLANPMLSMANNGIDVSLVRLGYFGYHGHLMFTAARPSWLCLCAFLRSIARLLGAFWNSAKAFTAGLRGLLMADMFEGRELSESVRAVREREDVRRQLENLSARVSECRLQHMLRIMPGDDAG